MGFPVEGRVSITSLSFQGGILKSLVLFVLAFSCLSLVGAAPTAVDDELQGRSPSANLFWGPEYIANLKLVLTNPHNGYAGPKFPNANHVNFHVYKKAPNNKWDEIVNVHIVKYGSSGKVCLYAWDSPSKKVIFDGCFDSMAPLIAKCVSVIKDFVDVLLEGANFLAKIALIAAMAVAIAAAIPILVVVGA